MLQGVRPVSNASASIGETTFIWDGATDTGVILKIYCAFGGKIDSINFNGMNKSGFGVVFQHDATVGGAVVEHWMVSNCTLAASRKYNVLIGATDDDTSHVYTGDVSLVNFHNCYFQRAYPPQGSTCPTEAHVFQSSSNGLANAFYSCQFDGDGTYPTYGAMLRSGTIYFYGMVSVGIGSGGADLYVGAQPASTTPPRVLQQPAAVLVYGWESQSANFLRAPNISGTYPVRPTVLSGVSHQDIAGTGAESVVWAAGAWGPLVLEGCRFMHDVKIDNTDSKVFVLGVLFDSIGGHGIRQPTGASTVSGTWYEYPHWKSVFLNT